MGPVGLYALGSPLQAATRAKEYWAGLLFHCKITDGENLLFLPGPREHLRQAYPFSLWVLVTTLERWDTHWR